MKNIIRNLALGLSLSLPSLAIAQLGTSWLDAPSGGPQRALEVAADGGTVTKGWMRVGGGYLSLQTTNSAADVNLVCKGPGPNDQLTLNWSQYGFSSIQSGTWGANPKPLVVQGGGGNVGVGMLNPGVKLDVAGPIRSLVDDDVGGNIWLENPRKVGNAAHVWKLFNMTGAYGDSFQIWNYPGVAYSRLVIKDEGTTILVPSGGNVGIGTATPIAKLDVNGTTRTKALELTGGADIAEAFDVAGEPQPGMVVRPDPDREGALKICATEYDRAAIGVVSGAGGIVPATLLRQEGTVADGAHPVAMLGRVYVLTDASLAPIKPGDELTSSTTPGHAMKATDDARANRAVLGTALTSLASGRGLVLIALQRR